MEQTPGEERVMNNTATEAGAILVDRIQVNENRNFAGHRWREAILCYLNGIWADRHNVDSRRIYFVVRQGNKFPHVALYLHHEDYCFGSEMWIKGNGGFRLPSHQYISTNCRRAEVEQGLIRFAKDDRLQTLMIASEERSEMLLWKSEKRAELYVASYYRS
ncbi:MAG: hypothetical protein A2945_04715 [Candidatus Liptonbacteria bacterium RIFCSPLOWO2_01_FULL_52_25]|uniref:Uncharacterized protein n=1 Tax=Candidatus Liptonbacteria bacterium RIFCSPLOWO2_01_FULL_52_25 TaxID=1798650 RepID=A0A1G2CCZ2_9BACT|nr:MAG: hypothetical protein A2945_04715 [Candidatus Liptonbacteria bacterium RIFCSPLOWO2_01_FULL_52_25]